MVWRTGAFIIKELKYKNKTLQNNYKKRKNIAKQLQEEKKHCKTTIRREKTLQNNYKKRKTLPNNYKKRTNIATQL